MDHASYIDQIIEIKQETHVPAGFSLLLGTSSHQILKKIKDNQYLSESEGKEYLLQIVTPPAHKLSALEAELKQRESITAVISGLLKKVYRVNDELIIKTEVTRKISLQEYFDFKSDPRIPASLKEKTGICVDVIVKALCDIVSNVAALERKGLAQYSLLPENIYIEISDQPMHPIFASKSLGFEIKIDLFGADPLQIPQMTPLASLAHSLYSALRNEACDYISIDSQVNKDYPYALCNIIASLLQPETKAEEILFSPLVSTWIYLFKEYDSITNTLSFSTDALLTGLYFKNKASRIKAVLTLISQEKENLLHTISSNPCGKENAKNVKIIINSVCRFKYWNNNIEICKIAVNLLKKLIKKKMLSESGPLKLYKALLLPEADPVLIKKICYRNTMTAAGLVGSYKNLVEKVALDGNYTNYIIPYMGLRTIHYLQAESSLMSIQKLEILSLTPIHIRVSRATETLAIVRKIHGDVKNKDCCTRQIFLMKSVRILREMLYDAEIAHSNNKIVKCYENPLSLNSSVLMAMCTKCNITNMCLVCASFHNEDHQLSYTSSIKRCEKQSPSPGICSKDLFELKEITLELFDSQGNQGIDGVFCSGNSSEEISITSMDEIKVIYDDSCHSTLLYFEVEILSAGFSENISIGIDGIGVFYTGSSGAITNSEGALLKKAARFGTGDVIGIGFTSSHFLYYTYNGYNLQLYTECTQAESIRPLVNIKGKGISVKIITKNFNFSLEKYKRNPKITEQHVKDDIKKWLFIDLDQEIYDNVNATLSEIPELRIAMPLIRKRDSKKMNACKEACIVS